jgi:hypothetical protein
MGYSEEIANTVSEMLDGTFDFTRCERADGSAYGTSGRCRKGTQAEKEENTSNSAKEERSREFANFRFAVTAAVISNPLQLGLVENIAKNGSFTDSKNKEIKLSKKEKDIFADPTNNLSPFDSVMNAASYSMGQVLRDHYSGDKQKLKDDIYKSYTREDPETGETLSKKALQSVRNRYHSAFQDEYAKTAKMFGYEVEDPKKVKPDDILSAFYTHSLVNQEMNPDDAWMSML